MKQTLLFLFSCITCLIDAQLRNSDVYKMPDMDISNIREEIRIPDFDGYQTLKCDFHIHTIFSDGEVWPNVRVNEAWAQGLDAIAITDHIEYRPYKDILKGDLNESFKIAKKRGEDIGFIVIQGTEITRDKPLGHLNALFIQDAEAMDVSDPLEAMDEAIRQGAFIMWNHPGWPDNKSTFYPIHEKLISENKIHGIETFNYLEYYPVSFDWCKNMNLAFMANSDIHEPITQLYGGGKNLRPLTLVFAKEKTEESIKEALLANRSAAFFDGKLAGKREHLTSLILASLKVKRIHADKDLGEITNSSDIPFQFLWDNKIIEIFGGKTVRVNLPKEKNVKVLNCYTGMNENLEIEWAF